MNFRQHSYKSMIIYAMVALFYVTFLIFLGLDLSVSTGCCVALDHIVTFLFTNWQKATKSNNPMKELIEHPAIKILELRSEIFQQVIYYFGNRSEFNVNTDYVKVPIFPDFVDNFPNFPIIFPDFVQIKQFVLVKSQLSHGLYPPLGKKGKSGFCKIVFVSGMGRIVRGCKWSRLERSFSADSIWAPHEKYSDIISKRDHSNFI